MRWATFVRFRVLMGQSFYLTVVVDNSFEICLREAVLSRAHAQSSCLVTVTNKQGLTLAKTLEWNEVLPLWFTYRRSETFRCTSSFCWPDALVSFSSAVLRVEKAQLWHDCCWVYFRPMTQTESTLPLTSAVLLPCISSYTSLAAFSLASLFVSPVASG